MTTTQEFFEQKYQLNPDPWAFATDPYERGRYGAILRALDGRRFRRAFEPGCSIGVLTAGLASISDAVVAMDISRTAVAGAQARCKGLSHVSVTCGKIPENLPTGLFDLVVFSEIGYYFERPRLREVAGQLTRQLANGGIFLAAHWLGTSEDHILSGDQVHALLRNSLEESGLARSHAECHAEFRLDCWTKTAPRCAAKEVAGQ